MIHLYAHLICAEKQILLLLAEFVLLLSIVRICLILICDLFLKKIFFFGSFTSKICFFIINK